jgi:hypothetical protein
VTVPVVPSLDVAVIVTERLVGDIAVNVMGVVARTGPALLTVIVLGSEDDHVTIRWPETSVLNESMSCAVAVVVDGKIVPLELSVVEPALTLTVWMWPRTTTVALPATFPGGGLVALIPTVPAVVPVGVTTPVWSTVATGVLLLAHVTGTPGGAVVAVRVTGPLLGGVA